MISVTFQLLCYFCVFIAVIKYMYRDKHIRGFMNWPHTEKSPRMYACTFTHVLLRILTFIIF